MKKLEELKKEKNKIEGKWSFWYETKFEHWGTYSAFDRDTGELLYIGQSMNVKRRCRYDWQKPSQWIFGNRKVDFYLITNHSRKNYRQKGYGERKRRMLNEESNLIYKHQPIFNIQSK